MDGALVNLPLASDALHELRISGAGTQFSVWAPTADAVQLLLYKHGEGGEPIRREPMRKCDDGTWRIMLEPNLKGRYFYTYQARFGREWKTPVPGLAARAVGTNGKRAAVVDPDDGCPQGWEQDGSPHFEHPADAVIYEVHLRDISVSADSGIRCKGGFLSLVQAGSRSPQGEYTGLDHLRQLGVTHVHLLPIFDFASIDESQPADGQYNWGYDPQNYFVPEGSYSTDASDPLCRIRELREMVMALHGAGLRVVMDVVFNHTCQVEGGNFECLVPGYFYRRMPDGCLANGSGCGNETASERSVVRRFMVECLMYWMTAYHIDGFRFDLMGLHDIETMRHITTVLRATNPSVLLYGEAWSGGAAALSPEQGCLKCNMIHLPGLAAFGDELRDGLRGPWMDRRKGGFLCGEKGYEESVKFGITGGVGHPQVDCSRIIHSNRAWAGSPEQMINYVSCHDDWTLADRLRAVSPQSTTEERLNMCRLAYTILLTSQGIPFLLAGEDFFRTRRGYSNPYNAPDEINAVRWTEKYIYKRLFEYVRELIRIRKSSPLFRLRSAEDVRHCITFLPTSRQASVAYCLSGSGMDGELKNHTFYILCNGNADSCYIRVPKGAYEVLCRDGKASACGLGVSRGGLLRIAGQSAVILKQK